MAGKSVEVCTCKVSAGPYSCYYQELLLVNSVRGFLPFYNWPVHVYTTILFEARAPLDDDIVMTGKHETPF